VSSRRPVIGVIDYGMGNRRSVQKALEHVGAEVLVTGERDALRACAGLVLPGVGAFPTAMGNLEALGLTGWITEQVARGVPLLGVCLGMQLLFETSEEQGQSRGLGLLAGTVTRLEPGPRRIPHIGWNEVVFARPSRLTTELPPGGCPFYHVHSFAARPARADDVVGTTEYGERFATIVEHGGVLGVQFHPEKSSGRGLTMLANFVALSREVAASRSSGAPAALSA
jgi:imidazole glycerol-phosphate synthase subunit HisH